MVILTKLLEMSIVANNFCDLPSNLLMMRSLALSLSSISLRSEGVSEKKAISDADTKPEQKSNAQANRAATTTPTEGAVNEMEEKASTMGCHNDDRSNEFLSYEL